MADAYRARFELTGVTPLIMHWDNIQGGDELKAWRQDPKNKNQSTPGDDRTPAWTWHTYVYRDDDGHVAIPHENVMAALMWGGAQMILKKSKTFKQLSQTAIFISSLFLKFTYNDNKQLTVTQLDKIRELEFSKQAAACADMGFSLFMKRVSVGKAKHVRIRPRFDAGWKVEGELTVRDVDMTFERLQTLFNHAGEMGLCDWRPSSPKRPGPYGMFEAKVTQLKR